MTTAASARPAPSTGWFTIPDPLRRLFKRFPLITYAPNELPIRSPSDRHLPTLYVFASEEDALKGLPSFNPSCLKWQTFLRLAGVEFHVISSSNHASPTGALPFLLPPSTPDDADSQTPVPWNHLEKYALEKGAGQVPDVPSMRLEAYQSLLDHRIRNAWLYSLYVSPPNSALLYSLYITPITTSAVVQNAIFYQLRRAAEKEILKSVVLPRIQPSAVYKGAEEALEALAVVLGSNDWFFENSGPGLFDAAVFSYTHLLLDERLAWADTRLKDTLQKFPRLVDHRNRILERCWGATAKERRK